MSYFFHPAAEAEHLESIAYFESKRPGLGATYLSEFERVMGIVCESPHTRGCISVVGPGGFNQERLKRMRGVEPP